METQQPMPDAGPARENPTKRRRNKAYLGLVAVLATVAFAWGIRSYLRDHDTHVVRAFVREIETKVRVHDEPGLWLLVERNDPPGKPDTEEEQRHQAILHTFERLSHLEEFKMTDVDVDVQGEEARVSYRMSATSPAGQPPPPYRGEMRLVRDGSNWRLVEHRLLERSGETDR